jgi:hypothetical protein
LAGLQLGAALLPEPDGLSARLLAKQHGDSVGPFIIVRRYSYPAFRKPESNGLAPGL